MKHSPFTPKFIGLKNILNINLREVVPFINWKYFFRAWRLNGKYDGIDLVCDCASCRVKWLQNFSMEDKVKAEEALKLYSDAKSVLFELLNNELVNINASLGIYPAFSSNDDIIIGDGEKEIKIPVLRQQTSSDDGFCYSLADFLATENDYIGAFAVTVKNTDEIVDKYEKNGDIYHSILIKTFADRLVEAASEWLHYQVRKKYWGYNPDEQLDVAAILKNNFPGIRPAVGYPSLPDQSIIFEVRKLLDFEEIGISVTENGAMIPNSSICGLYFSHPLSKYFLVGKIDDKQLSDYARRRDKRVEEMQKWLSVNI